MQDVDWAACVELGHGSAALLGVPMDMDPDTVAALAEPRRDIRDEQVDVVPPLDEGPGKLRGEDPRPAEAPVGQKCEP